MTQERIRAFVAIELAPGLRESLAEALDALRQAHLRGLRLVDPEAIHLTLKFLGDVPVPTIPEIASALKRVAEGVPPLTLALDRAGGFPSLERPRVLWVGLRGDLPTLQRLQGAVETALADLGFPREPRSFSPHLTLARVRPETRPEERRRIGERSAQLSVSPAEMRAEEVALMRSDLRPTGAVYTRLEVAQLGRPSP